MKTIEESVVTAMDGSDKELFPYLPYILQDLWEIGADPYAIIKLIGKHFTNCANLKVLDLGCGKGAVSIKVSQKYGCHCYGIDAIPEFIDLAKEKAIDYKVEHLCTFEIGDIREKVSELSGYDIIILGAIGPVFGDYYSTLTTLSKCLNKSGIFVIDDGYIENNSDYIHPLIQKKNTIIQQIDSAGMQLIEDDVIQKDDIKDSNDYIFDNLKKRCFELINKYPDKKELFESYIKNQEIENDVLENKVVCSTLIIKRKN
ncbi:MAG: methyltransferase domain-containing protein [Bacteroidetes bacterium]|nr:methyltransferase domain-containing protein [Bacteroidota bacterium]MBL6944024.1 methyltransferase domain-containing protein [Bacteroidales bacterium]